MREDDDFVTIRVTGDPLQAEVWAEVLADHGIVCTRQGTNHSALFPTYPVIQIPIQVLSSDAERALEVLAAIDGDAEDMKVVVPGGPFRDAAVDPAPSGPLRPYRRSLFVRPPGRAMWGFMLGALGFAVLSVVLPGDSIDAGEAAILWFLSAGGGALAGHLTGRRERQEVAGAE